jgi:GntR family transcriptional regulator
MVIAYSFTASYALRSIHQRVYQWYINFGNLWKMPVKNALPIYVQISEMLIRDVSAGHYLDGARLPPERQLATDLGVSVTTLRKALDDMAQKGMLERRQGSGNYIKTGAELASVYSFFRVELIAGGGLPTAELLALDRIKKPSGFPAFGPSDEAYRIRRLRRLNGAPAVLEEIWLDGDQSAQINAEDLSESLYLFYRKSLNLWIAEAEDQLDLAKVPDWSPQMFGPPPGENCLCAQRLSRSQRGAVVEFSLNWIDTKIARYVARIK